MPFIAFALPCSTTGTDTNRGDTIEAVMQRCGTPLAQNAYSKTTISTQKWFYYLRTPSNILNKVSFFFKDSQIVSIDIDGISVASSGICGPMLQTGNTVDDVAAACGDPIYKQPLESNTVQVSELQYSDISPKTWIFEDGKLVDWQ